MKNFISSHVRFASVTLSVSVLSCLIILFYCVAEILLNVINCFINVYFCL
jgi:hypothetical protein